MSSAPPGWYDDGRGTQRYWDGVQWTDRTRLPVQAPPVQGAPGQPFAGVPPMPPTPRGGVNKVAIGIAAVALVIVGVAVVLVVTLRGGGPQDAVDEFLEAGWDFENERQCEMMTHESQAEYLQALAIDSCAEIDPAFKEQVDQAGVPGGYEAARQAYLDTDFTREFGEVTEHDDEAEVQVSIFADYQGDHQEVFDAWFGTEPDSDAVFALKKEDGEWKVDEATYS